MTDNIMILNAMNNKQPQEGQHLVEIEEIPNTPFHRIGTEEQGYFASFGKYRLTPPMDKETLKNYLQENFYTVIGNLVISIVEIDKTLKTENND